MSKMCCIGKVAQVQCLDEKGYWMKRSLFLNVDDLPDWWSIVFLKRLEDVPDSYTTIRSVLYD